MTADIKHTAMDRSMLEDQHMSISTNSMHRTLKYQSSKIDEIMPEDYSTQKAYNSRTKMSAETKVTWLERIQPQVQDP